MKKQIMQEQELGWQQYYTIPSKYEDFCEFFRHHQIIGKYFPKDGEDFVIQLIFEVSKEEKPGWYLMIMNYTKKITIEFHVYKWSEHEFACCDARFRKHSIFAKWSEWKRL